MADNPKILTIDDDSIVQSIVRQSLESNYQLFSEKSGSEGIESAIRNMPDVILLDIEMPEMNGYETCKHLKADERTSNIPVIFISNLSDIQSRVLSFEAGGIDFLTKPFDQSELLAKLNIITTFIKSNKALSNEVTKATTTAYTAMRGSSELGLAIQFIESSYSAKSLNALASKFFNVTSSLGLNCSLMFIGRKERSFYSSESHTISPLEREVISTIHENGNRFIDFGSRTQINYPRVALLVKNMPVDEIETYGRYKDFLPTMLGSTDAKVQSLETEQALVDQARELGASFTAVKSTLIAVGESLEKNQNDIVQLLQSMLSELEEKIPRMGLEDDQESYIVTRVDTTIAAAEKIIDSSTNTSHAFKSVSRLLQHLADKQQALLHSVVQNAPTDKESDGGMEDGFSGEIDLF
ncbi:response regulator [Alkalimarinus coralli]|uniref:response regulator n=1 Tax=Alkalimarinus coralli TaxID=2935863 RepID=UPI00202B427E|nr:response regulator [Alkalimarinus coralli]